MKSQDNVFEITHFSARFREVPEGEVPFGIVNLVFKVNRSHDSWLWDCCKKESEDYVKMLSIESPEHFEKFLSDEFWDFSASYPYEKVWVQRDSKLTYIEKFDIFWHRGWVSDNLIVRAVVQEFEHFMKTGCFPAIYRHTPGCTLLRHVETLDLSWD